MRHIAKYLHLHANGTYYSHVAKVWRSLRTKDKREAKRLLRGQLAPGANGNAVVTTVIADSPAPDRGLEVKVEILTQQLEKLTAALATEHRAAAKILKDPQLPFEQYEQQHLKTLCDTVAPRSRDMYKASSKKMLDALRAQCSKGAFDDASAPTSAQLLEALRLIGPTGVWDYWKTERQSGASGLNHIRCYLNQFITQACDDEILPDKFLKQLKRIPILQIDPDVPTIPSLRDMNQLLIACRAVDEASGDIIDFAAFTGARPCNIELLEWKDANMAQRLINFTQDGTREAVDMSQQAYDLLEKLRRDRANPTGRIFYINDYRIKKCRRILRGCVAGLLEEHPDLKDMTDLKSLRHYFASVCVMASIDFKTIAIWLGHNDGGRLVASTYGHLRRDHTKAAMASVRFSAKADESVDSGEIDAAHP